MTVKRISTGYKLVVRADDGKIIIPADSKTEAEGYKASLKLEVDLYHSGKSSLQTVEIGGAVIVLAHVTSFWVEN